MGIVSMQNRPLRRKPLFVLLCLLAGVLAPLVGLEIALRLWWPQMGFFDNVGSYLADRDLGFRLCPNVVNEGRQLTNSLGLHNREISIQKPPGTFRILALGDSFTFGVVEMEKVWPQVLEQNLQQRFPGRSLEVVNAGISCFSTYQELAYLHRSLLELEPDLVVLGFFVGNDIGENIRGIGHSVDPQALDLELPQRRMNEVLGCLGLETLDLLPRFRINGQRRRLYEPWDTHWNEAGNALAAHLLANSLASRELRFPVQPEPGPDC